MDLFLLLNRDKIVIFYIVASIILVLCTLIYTFCTEIKIAIDIWVSKLG